MIKTLRDIISRLQYSSEQARELIWDCYNDKLTKDDTLTQLDNLFCIVDSACEFLTNYEHIKFEETKMVKKSPPKKQGFKKVQSKIAKQQEAKGVPAAEAKERAGRILASATRRASPAAKKRNPRLKKVKMPKRKK